MDSSTIMTVVAGIMTIVAFRDPLLRLLRAGSRKKWKNHLPKHDDIRKAVESNPSLFAVKAEEYGHTETEALALATKRCAHLVEHLPAVDPSDIVQLVAYHRAMVYDCDVSTTYRFSVQFNLFAGSVQSLGTDKHRGVVQEAVKFRTKGVFALTEKIYGVMSGMKCGTTASYDPKANTFTIDSVSAEFEKQWISFACNKDAKYAVVFARLLVHGAKNGPVCAFLVTLRDDKGELVPGIAIGGMGDKTGVKGNDNGWISFKAVQVPYDTLLDKYVQVVDNKVVLPFGTSERSFFYKMIERLMTGRLCIATASTSMARLSVTLAIKYAVVRDHWEGHGEVQRLLCDALAEVNRMEDIAASALHDYLSGCTDTVVLAKGYNTPKVVEIVTLCRGLCGGYGLLCKSRFPEMLEAAASLVVVEGDAALMKQAYVRTRMTKEWSWNKLKLVAATTMNPKADVQPAVFRAFDEYVENMFPKKAVTIRDPAAWLEQNKDIIRSVPKF